MVERGKGKEPVKNHESILVSDFIDFIMQGARENLTAHGRLSTALFLRLDNGERGLVPLSFPPTHEEKRMYLTFLGYSFLEAGRQIQEAILVSESWYVESPKGDYPPQVAPSQHPQRKEAIALVGRDILAQQFVFAIQPFQRDLQGQPVFEPLALEQFNEQPDDNYYSTGLLDHLFPEVSSDHLC